MRRLSPPVHLLRAFATTARFGSISRAAEALGISRRMVSYYRTAHKSIPRQTWLACLGWEAVKPEARSMPRSLPTALEYAALHA